MSAPPVCKCGHPESMHAGGCGVFTVGPEGWCDCPAFDPMPPTPHLLTPVQGGHVWPGTWEALQWQHSAECAACGASLRSNGLRTLRPLGEGLCQGWKNPSARPVLPDLVRGMIREAPDGAPNGPSEEAILDLHEKQLAATGPHDGIKMLVSVARNLAASDAAGRLCHSLADDARALRLALEHDERSAR